MMKCVVFVGFNSMVHVRPVNSQVMIARYVCQRQSLLFFFQQQWLLTGYFHSTGKVWPFISYGAIVDLDVLILKQKH